MALAPLLFAAGTVGAAGIGDVVRMGPMVMVEVPVGVVWAAGAVSRPVAIVSGGDSAASDGSAVRSSPSLCCSPDGIGGVSTGLPVLALMM